MYVKNSKQTKGITLVALVISIVIIIILATIAINFTFGDNGLITMALYAKDKTEESILNERIAFASLEWNLKSDEEKQKWSNENPSYTKDLNGYLKWYLDINNIKIFDRGSGTAQDPYIITKELQFKNLSIFPNDYFSLNNNLDFENESISTIFSATNPFNGFLNGNGFTVSNIQLKDNSLLGFTSNNCIIQNVNFENITMEINENIKQNTNLGLLINTASGGELNNIRVEGNLKVVNTNLKSDSNIMNCVGGVVGNAQNTNITNCIFKGNIDISNFGVLRCGGIVGRCAGAMTIDKCGADVSMNFDNILYDGNVGGIVGYAYSDAYVKYSYSRGNIYSNSKEYQAIGGIIGYSDGYNTLNRSYSLISIECTGEGEIDIGGICGGKYNPQGNGWFYGGYAANSIDVSKMENDSQIYVGGVLGKCNTYTNISNISYDATLNTCGTAGYASGGFTNNNGYTTEQFKNPDMARNFPGLEDDSDVKVFEFLNNQYPKFVWENE